MIWLGLFVGGCTDGIDTDANSVPDTAEDRVTWSNFSQEFMADYCVSCHSPEGQASANFARYNVVTQRLNAIRCGVAPELLENCEGEHPPGWFPIGPGPFPSDDERWKLVGWIDDGAPREQ